VTNGLTRFCRQLSQEIITRDRCYSIMCKTQLIQVRTGSHGSIILCTLEKRS